MKNFPIMNIKGKLFQEGTVTNFCTSNNSWEPVEEVLQEFVAFPY